MCRQFDSSQHHSNPLIISGFFVSDTVPTRFGTVPTLYGGALKSPFYGLLAAFLELLPYTKERVYWNIGVLNCSVSETVSVNGKNCAKNVYNVSQYRALSVVRCTFYVVQRAIE